MNIRIRVNGFTSQYDVVTHTADASYIYQAGKREGSCGLWSNSDIQNKIDSGAWLVVSHDLHDNPFNRTIGGI